MTELTIKTGSLDSLSGSNYQIFSLRWQRACLYIEMMLYFNVLENKIYFFFIFLVLDSPHMNEIILIICVHSSFSVMSFFGIHSTCHILNRPKDEISCNDVSMRIEGIVHACHCSCLLKAPLPGKGKANNVPF